MQKIELKPSYDVVVIGAGVGGLTTAALLSKAGLSVCVLEKEPHAGGYLAGFRRKDFRFDTAIHWLNQYGPDGLVTKVFAAIGNDYPKAVVQKRIKLYKGDKHDYILTDDPDQWRDQLIEEYPNSKAGIIKFFKAAKKIGKSFKNFGNIFRSEETMSPLKRLANKFRLLQFALPFIPYITYKGDKGMQKGLDKFFKDEGLQKIFSSEAELLGCLVPIGWAYYKDFQSPPEGGGQAIPEWLQHVITYFGNDLFFKCDVKEVLLEDKQAKGVRFECRGKEYTVSSKYVVAACDVETLYEKMLPADAIPQKLKDRLKDAELYASSVTVSIALDCPPSALGFGEEMVHISSEATTRDDDGAGDPEKSEIIILAPSHRDKTLAPEGQGTLTLFMPALMSQYNEWETEKDEKGNYIRGEAYKANKFKIAEAIINRVSKEVASNLKEHILFYDVATPVTHYRYTSNRGGTMMGARPGKKNMQSKVAHYKTPIKHLLLGGHWAELGGGVPIATKAGANAALLIFKEENKVAYKALGGYMEGKVTLKEILDSKAFKPYNNSWVRKPTPAEKLAARKANSMDNAGSS
ncbi:MAG: NAD(P)/FAD-dependent oxidoreductase [Flavipsychrobacter sp.]